MEKQSQPRRSPEGIGSKEIVFWPLGKTPRRLFEDPRAMAGKGREAISARSASICVNKSAVAAKSPNVPAIIFREGRRHGLQSTISQTAYGTRLKTPQ
jgi:hypothetical protein